ncbi:MAG: Tryptophan-rich protein, partial [Pseudomonadota bacterium]|nr:Tryptophan-rich protein [Pseudomonadota bacterium]
LADRVQSCILEAVHSRRETEIDWRELKNDARWQIGWR